MRPTDVGFDAIEYTDFAQWAVMEVTALARSLDEEAIAADARAVKAAGERLADSVAELEADVGRSRERWRGLAAEVVFASLGRYSARAYDTGATATSLAGAVDGLATAASGTRTGFGDLAVPREVMLIGSGSPSFVDEFRAQVAAGMRSKYSEPIAGSNDGVPTHVAIGAPEFGSVSSLRDMITPEGAAAAVGTGLDAAPGYGAAQEVARGSDAAAPTAADAGSGPGQRPGAAPGVALDSGPQGAAHVAGTGPDGVDAAATGVPGTRGGTPIGTAVGAPPGSSAGMQAGSSSAGGPGEPGDDSRGQALPARGGGYRRLRRLGYRATAPDREGRRRWTVGAPPL
ncbi:hypothetical protein P0W64_18210, partial [Tsukamurella sp. 8F]|nr:hypothetical protein [Tsukamurella sp. 8F]